MGRGGVRLERASPLSEFSAFSLWNHARITDVGWALRGLCGQVLFRGCQVRGGITATAVDWISPASAWPSKLTCLALSAALLRGDVMDDSEITLDARTGAAYLEFVQACALCKPDVEAFRLILRRHVKQLLPHSASIAVLGRLSFDQLIISHMIGVDYPDAFLAA